MVQIQDRQALQDLLDDDDFVLLLLVADEAGHAEAIHDMAASAFRRSQKQRVPVLMADTSLLTPTEQRKWVGSAGRYAVIARRTRAVPQRGPVADLLKSEDRPAIRAIRGAFLSGERRRRR